MSTNRILSSGIDNKLHISEDSSDNSIAVEVVTFDIPREEVLNQAFEKIRTLPKHLKPIVMEGFAKKLKITKKTLEKSFEIWAMERISQITAVDAQNNQNSEEV